MNEVQKPAERFCQGPLRCVGASVAAVSNTCCTRRREKAVLVAKMPSSGSLTRTGGALGALSGAARAHGGSYSEQR